MRPDECKRVLKLSDRVHGWFSTEAAMLFAWVDEIQKQNGVGGNVFEIGCHHGKSAVVLGAMVRVREQELGVCDLFGDQDANLSGSGSGDLAVFEQTMAPLREAGLALTVHRRNSADLTAEEVGGGYRFFHVDGGHNCDEALSDLRLAARCVSPRGVVVADDPFRPEWPGVTEAVLRFLDEHDEFRAVALGFNKIVLTRTDSADLYLSEFGRKDRREAYGLGYPWHTKTLPFGGHEVLIFYVPSYVPRGGLPLLLRRWYRNDGRYSTPLRVGVKVAGRLAGAARTRAGAWLDR